MGPLSLETPKKRLPRHRVHGENGRTIRSDAKLSDEMWLALRAEWEAGICTDRELALKYGISPNIITSKKKREGWIRSDEVEKRVKKMVAPSWKELKVKMEHGDNPEDNVVPYPGAPMPEALREELLKYKREVAVEKAVATIQEATTAHLKAAAKLRDVTDSYADLLKDLLTGNDEIASNAAKRLMVGNGDKISSLMGAFARAIEAVQKVERTALGLDGGRLAEAQNTVSSGVVTNDPKTGMPVIDVTQMTDDELSALQRVIERLDSQRDESLPLPPRGPETC